MIIKLEVEQSLLVLNFLNTAIFYAEEKIKII